MSERQPIEDITKLKAGDVLLVNTTVVSARMTVTVPYDVPKEGRYRTQPPGVLCHKHRTGGSAGGDFLLTEGVAETATIFLLNAEEQKLAGDLDTALDHLASDPNGEQKLLDRIMNDDD